MAAIQVKKGLALLGGGLLMTSVWAEGVTNEVVLSASSVKTKSAFTSIAFDPTQNIPLIIGMMLVWLMIFGFILRYLLKLADNWQKKFAIRNKNDLKMSKMVSYTYLGLAYGVVALVLSSVVYIVYENSNDWKKNYEARVQASQKSLDYKDAHFAEHP